MKTRIGTIASHSALNIISGARAEGFETVLLCTPEREAFYRAFGLGGSLRMVGSFEQVLELDLDDTVLIPHGSFVAYIGADRLLKSDLRMFGNRQLLKWEGDRQLKTRLLQAAGMMTPKEFSSPDEIDCPVIAKTHGAAGGTGYFIARGREEARQKMVPGQEYMFQQYVVGTKVYVTYFNSLARGQTEVFGADIRYETDADANLRFDTEPSFVVVGNLPLVLRESTLSKYYNMGVRFVDAFRQLVGQELPGPFCLETIIDRHQQVYAFEFSGRIVAGTNIWIPYSPYSYVQFGEPMWMGRRIAREIKELLEQERLDEALL